MSIENKQMIWISGCIDKIIYDNKKGFMIFVLRKKTNSIIVKGEFLQIPLKSSIRILGYYVRDKKYGKQFSAISYQFVIPENIYSWQKWLASGIIKGIRTKNARKIIDYFGEDTMNILNGQPEELAKVPGISLRQANIICDKFQEHTQNADILISLCNYGIPVHIGKKIIKKYGTKTIQQLQENPYKVADQVASLGFKTIDPIALRIGIDEKSDYRIQSAFLYLLNQAEQEGHVYLPENILLRNASNLLGFPVSFLKDSLLRSNLKRVEDQSEIYVYRPWKYKEEIDITHILVKLAGQRESDIKKQEETLLQQYSDTANEEQLNAVRQALRSSLMILTGGPGTGKTTTINGMIQYFEHEGLDIRLAAPTGRAAKRMTEATGYEAMTIHRMLEINGEADRERDMKKGNASMFERNAGNPLETDVIIIDEMSMVDLYLMNALLQAMVPGTRLVIVGDANQLPSIGAGNVLKDMIASGQFKVVELNQIFRQEEGSHIVRNAHLIHQGRPVELDNKSRDFFFLQRNNIQDVLGVLVYLVRDKLPGYVHVKPYDIQILTPMRKGELGVERLNQVMQQYLNPPSDEKKEKEIAFGLFREGDKVMQIKNNYQIEWEMRNSKGFTVDKGVGVFNGDMGIITEINDYTEKITVLFDETREVQYPYASLDELELAYAITIHKSQGSEYPAVVMPILSGPRVLFHRNLLYTGVTRAKNCLTIVGDRNMLFSMIQNVNEQRRYTTLALRLDQIANESEESGPMDDLGI